MIVIDIVFSVLVGVLIYIALTEMSKRAAAHANRLAEEDRRRKAAERERPLREEPPSNPWGTP